MLKKFISATMCGMYIGIGATAFLLADNLYIGALFFTTGIFLVVNYFNMLYTRVCPLIISKEYKFLDLLIAFLGNLLGSVIYALGIYFTRINAAVVDKLTKIVEVKVNDSLLSLLITSIMCAVLVAYAVLSAKTLKEHKGLSFFVTFLFIAAFVVCGFDHIVANMFYYALYAFNEGFSVSMLPSFIVVLIGNTIGGLGIGLLEYYRKCEGKSR